MDVTEMRNFFDTIATNFVSLSEQARELQTLKGEVETLRLSLEGYRNESERVNKSAQDAWELVTMLEREKAEQARVIATFEKEREEYDTEITNQNNLIGTYSNDLHEANQTIQRLTDTNTGLHEANQARNEEVSSLNSRINGLVYQNEQLVGDRDYWKRQYNLVNDTIPEYQSRVTDLSNKLHEAEDQLAKIKAVFMSTTAPAPEPVSYPSSAEDNTPSVVNL